MLFTTLTVGDTEYKLRLNAKNAVALEQKLGRHPLAVLMDLQEATFPRVEEIVQILHAALQCYQPKFTLDKTYDMYDAYIEEGNSITEILNLLVEIYKTAGFIPENVEVEADESDEVKNS